MPIPRPSNDANRQSDEQIKRAYQQVFFHRNLVRLIKNAVVNQEIQYDDMCVLIESWKQKSVLLGRERYWDMIWSRRKTYYSEFQRIKKKIEKEAKANET